MTWDSTSAKAQLRSSIQRLGQLQAKKDADASITRRDIATLLQQGNVTLARSKAQKLIQEDSQADLFEVLEQQVGTLLDRFSELEQRSPPSPAFLEATSSIIFAASRTELRDLGLISDMISGRMGPGIVRSAKDNRDNYVSPGVLRATSRPAPNAAQLDGYLERIAKSYGISWTPGPQRQDLVNPLSEILDPGTTSSVDIVRLRKLCSRGIPDEPGWLRPRIWKLLLNILPADKAAWEREITKQRDSYYDLVRRLLRPFTELPTAIQPFSGPDERLFEVYNQLSRIPADLFNQLDLEPEELETCPLNQNAPENIRIPFANCLDSRLQHLRRLNGNDQNNSGISSTPEIRLEMDLDATPAISLTEPNVPLNDSNAPTTLLSSKSITLGSASQRHASALLRLLYIHASINPGNVSPYVPSLLVPLYTALLQEIEPEDMAHIEADSFWLFEAFVGEFAELEDEGSSDFWMQRLGEKLAQKDPELLEQLNDLGLHPRLPHYSRRWLVSILTHTLPLPNIYPIWDVMLSQPGRERNKHPRLDSLVEVCTAMLISAKPLLFKYKHQKASVSLWDRDPLTSAAQPGEGFLEALSVLQSYPIHLLGGIDTILQVALDFNDRPSPSIDDSGKNDQRGLGARIKGSMWKGFMNQPDSPEWSDEEESSSGNEEQEGFDEGNDTETPDKNIVSNTLTSRIANTVWRGITNQSSMEAPLSPIPSPDPSRPTTPPNPPNEQTPMPESEPQKENSQSSPAGLWTYTEKLKDSDTMATLAKLSSNWRAKAMLSSWGRSKEPSHTPPSIPQETQSAMTSPVQRTLDPDFKRSSLPLYDHSGTPYSPPPRPTFRNPRDSYIPLEAIAPPLSPVEAQQNGDLPQGEKLSGSLLEKTRNLQSSLLSLARTPSPKMPPPTPPKTAPRPLMLSSSSLITSRSSGRSRVTPPPNISSREDWTDVMKLRNAQLHRDSISSVSSLSPSDPFHRKPEYDSDASTSRVVPLNRQSVSPMALMSKSRRSRPPSTASTASSEQAVPSTPNKEDTTEHGDTVGVVSPKDEVTPNGKLDAPIVEGHASLTRKSYRRKPQPALAPSGDTSDSSIGDTNSRAARLRAKRYPPRLSNLYIENTAQVEDTKRASPSNLTVPWPSEDQDMAITPKASTFDQSTLPQSPLKSPKTREERARKTSTNSRHRKLSNTNSNRESTVRHSRSYSAAEDGDDEGYDDLLSAYESEESSLLT